MKLTTSNIHQVLEFGRARLQRWLTTAFEHRHDCGNNEWPFRVFELMLRNVWNQPFKGACHDTSAIMFMMLSELGQPNELCIGQVKTPDGGWLDHSWIEVDGKVIDAAISLPQISGDFCSAPIFAAVDLETNEPMNHDYTQDDGGGFTDNALKVYGVPLKEFVRLPGGNRDLWTLTAKLLEELGADVDPIDLEVKYGDQMRSVRIKIPSI